MRKLLIPLVLAAALSVGGCASLAEQAIGLPSGVLTQSVQNPVTRDTLYKVENGLIVLVSGLNTYKRLCNSGTLPASCIGIVQRLQSYVHQARPLLRSLRTFVRKNDQVNAKVVFATLQDVLAQLRAEAQAAGVNVGATQ